MGRKKKEVDYGYFVAADNEQVVKCSKSNFFDKECNPAWNSVEHKSLVHEFGDRLSMGGKLYKSIECMLLDVDVRDAMDKIYDADIKDDVILLIFANGKVFRLPMSLKEYERDLKPHLDDFKDCNIDFKNTVMNFSVESKQDQDGDGELNKKYTFEFYNRKHGVEYFWNIPCTKKGLIDYFQEEINILQKRLANCALLINGGYE
jgi:hypothetical protein